MLGLVWLGRFILEDMTATPDPVTFSVKVKQICTPRLFLLESLSKYPFLSKKIQPSSFLVTSKPLVLSGVASLKKSIGTKKLSKQVMASLLTDVVSFLSGDSCADLEFHDFVSAADVDFGRIYFVKVSLKPSLYRL